MNRKLRGGFACDEGMSVLEVVIAAVILFFVLTAVLGLVATTTRMGLSARQRTALNNAVSSHIEEMRSFDYDQLAYPPDGLVPPERTLNVDGFTVTVQTQITDGAGESREVEMVATAVGNGFSPMTVTRHVAIRDPEGIIAMLEAGEGPQVTYVSPTPPQDSVIFSNSVWVDGNTAPLYIAVHVEADSEEAPITDVAMTCQSLMLFNGVNSLATSAQWQPNTVTFDESFHWNTEYVFSQEGQEDQRVEEGLRMVRTLATDSFGVQGVAERRFYVDNYAPNDPSVPIADVRTATDTRIGWERASEIDNDDVFAPFYQGQCWQVSASGSLVDVTPPELERIVSNAWVQTTVPFSRYEFTVASASYRFTENRPAVSVVEPYTAPPLLTGTATTTTYKDKGDIYARTIVELRVTPPTFPVSSIRYDLYRATTLAGVKTTLYQADVDPFPTIVEEYNKKIGKFGAPDPYYFAYKITYTPSVYKPGEETVVWSDIVGPVPATTGTAELVQTW